MFEANNNSNVKKGQHFLSNMMNSEILEIHSSVPGYLKENPSLISRVSSAPLKISLAIFSRLLACSWLGRRQAIGNFLLLNVLLLI
jgi:hypothetical protein